jgi:hypothetical protein
VLFWIPEAGTASLSHLGHAGLVAPGVLRVEKSP